MILQIKSTNPDLSYVLSKNPATGPLIKELRKGKCFGWYTEPQTYNLYFKDDDDEISYPQFLGEEFEYQNVSRYTNALCAANMIRTYFHSTLKTAEEKDVDGTFENTVTIPMMHVKREHRLKLFAEHFPEFQLEFKEVAHKNYQLIIKTKKSVHQLLNYVSLFSTFTSLANGDPIWVDDSMRVKYLDVLTVLDAPYFVRYMFKLNLLGAENSFKEFKPLLEKSSRYPIEMEFGDTGYMRRKVVQENLSFDKPIIEVGCGEGYYTFPFAKKNKAFQHHAIDIDKDILEEIKFKAKKKQIENVCVYESLDGFITEADNWQDAGTCDVEGKNFDMICVEVMEHMPLEDAKKFVTQMAAFKGLNKLILTTPNKDFNQYYAFEESDTRHDDHKFELTGDEFESFVKETIVGRPFKIEWIQLGDRVNGIAPTQGVIVQVI